MLREQGSGVLNDRHGEGGLAVVVGQLAHVLNGELLVGKLDVEMVGGGRDEETGQGIRRLTKNVADERLGDVASDGDAEVSVSRNVNDCVFVSWCAGGCWRAEACLRTCNNTMCIKTYKAFT